MRKTKILLLILFFSIFAILFSGCREGNSTNNRKARLIGNQNLELKNKIEQQKKLLDKCQNEYKKLKRQMDKNATNFMKVISDTHKENTKLKAENTALKEKIEQLEEKISIE